ncbi:MAG: hypothetical protein OHK0013_05340 [Sandaracinaceae bacterium]
MGPGSRHRDGGRALEPLENVQLAYEDLPRMSGKALVVRRYDRTDAGRRHQEDFGQSERDFTARVEDLAARIRDRVDVLDATHMPSDVRAQLDRHLAAIPLGA